MTRNLAILILSLATISQLHANAPVASYIFPAGGQIGTKVPVRVGGLFLHQSCGIEMLGAGVHVQPELQSIKTIWFEGPLISQPASQRKEDYPKDMAGAVTIDSSAPLGVRHWRLWTSEGAASSMKFVLGHLPEIIEDELDGDPLPVQVTLPVTVNGRVFPREDIDIWSFQAKKGQSVVCEVHAQRLGTPLDARLEIRGPGGESIAENDDTFGADPFVRFIAPADGVYHVRIHDIGFAGGQDHVYRLTITSGPYVERVYPLGGQRGSKVKFELTGQNLPQAPVEFTLPESASANFRHHVRNGAERSNDFILDVDTLPEILEFEPNNDTAQQKPVELPCVFNGRITEPGDVDCWLWTGRKGESYQFDLRAGRLQSPLDGVLILTDAVGKPLARAENTAANQLDPVLDFKVPADGIYGIQVQDRFRSRGGVEYAYRLRVTPSPAADFQLSFAEDAISLPRNGTAKLRVAATRVGGMNQPIKLVLDGLPDDVTITGDAIPPGKPFTDIVLKANEKAAIRTIHVRVTGTAEVAGQTVKRIVVRETAAEVDDVLLAVALPCPFKIESEYYMGFAPRGSTGLRRYKIERGGYEGPIEISLADRQARHLQGVTGPTIIVPAGQSDFTYPMLLPPWMEMGRTCRVCVMGAASIEENGAKHRVSFSSVEASHQFIAVIGASQLSLTLESESVTVPTGKAEAAIAVNVRRGEKLAGPVTVELVVPSHVRGITAAPVVIAAGQSNGTLRLQFAAEVNGPFTMPFTVRAHLLQEGHAVIGEAKLEVVER